MMGLKPAGAVSVSGAIAGLTRVGGWNVSASGASQVRLRDATVAGAILSEIRTAAAGSETVVYAPGYLQVPSGGDVYVEVAAGTVSVVVYEA